MSTNTKTIPVEDIISRADRDPGDISTLAASIEQLGLLQPIILVKTGTDKYEVIDGRRRFAAINQLSWSMLTEDEYILAPADEDPAVMAHAANVVRKDLTPAEEVRQLAALADTHSVERLAEMFGRTPGWIARRIRIRTLIPDWLKVLDDPEHAPAWTLDKLALIARQSEDVQKKLLRLSTGLHSVKHIEQCIADLNHRISAAKFDTADCAQCPNNTATENLLFDDCPADATCTDETCWIRKTLAMVKAALKKEKLIPIHGDGATYGRKDREYADSIDAEGKWHFETVRPPKKGETANAIIVCGDDIGERVVAVKRETPAPVSSAPKEKKIRTVKEMEAELSAKRNKRSLQLLHEWITKEYTVEMWMAKIADTETLPHLMIVLGLYGCQGKYTWDSRCSLVPADCQGAEPEKVRANAYAMALGKITLHLKAESERTLGSMSKDAGLAIAMLLRIQDKWNDLRQQAMIEIKEPKSLTEARERKKAAKK